jgi:hypothetical protein
VEGTETLVAKLLPGSGYLLGQQTQFTGTILDDDVAPVIEFENAISGSSEYVEDGLSFIGVPVVSSGTFLLAEPDNQFAYAYTGSKSLHSSNFFDDVRMQETDGSNFGVTSIQLDQWYDQNASETWGVPVSSTVEFRGTKADGSTITQAFTTDDQKGLQTFNFNSDFHTGLTSMIWSQDNHVNLDYIVLV